MVLSQSDTEEDVFHELVDYFHWSVVEDKPATPPGGG